MKRNVREPPEHIWINIESNQRRGNPSFFMKGEGMGDYKLKYRKQVAGLTLILSLVMGVIGPAQSFVFAAPEENAIAPIEEKQVVKKEVQKDNAEKDDCGKLTVTSDRNGGLTIVGEGYEYYPVKEGETKELSVNVGNEYEIYANGDEPTLKLDGASQLSRKEIKYNVTKYVIKITNAKSGAAVSFRVKPGYMFMARSASIGGNVTNGRFAIRAGGSQWNGGTWVCQINDGRSPNLDACCSQAAAHINPNNGQGGSMSMISNSDIRAKMAYVCYQNWGGNDDTKYSLSRACSIACGYTTYGGYGYSNKAAVEAFYRQAQNTTVPSNFEVYQFYPSNGSQQQLCWRIQPYGRVSIKKSVKNNEKITKECKDMYSLADAEYTVYKDSNLTAEIGKLITEENGTTNILELEAGSYWIKETKAPKGYALDNKIYPVTVTSGNTAVVESKDVPLFAPISIILEKVADGKSYINAGDMSGAEFIIKYYDTLGDLTSLKSARTWKLKTKKTKNGKYLSGLRREFLIKGSDEVFKDENGVIVLPRGRISIQETKAPKGYALDPKVYVFDIDADNEDYSMHFNLGMPPKQQNIALKPRISTTATSVKTRDHIAEYGKRVKIADKVEYKELWEGEKYTVKGVLMDKDTKRPLLASGKEIRAEKTFTVTKGNSTISPEKGASGTICLEYCLDSTELAGKTTVVFESLFHEGKEIATHADIDDEGQTVYFPEIGTEARDGKDGDKLILAEKEALIVDKVSYKNLEVGKEYTFSGKLMDKSTGKEVMVNGKPITSTKTIVAGKADGFVEIAFKFNSKVIEGKTLVVFEKIEKEGITYAVHADIEDKGQSVKIPRIKTTATSEGKKIISPSKEIKIKDVVEYEKLEAVGEYTLSGELINKKTGQVVAKAEKKFAPKRCDGTIELEFIFDGSKMKNVDVVAFETLSVECGGKVQTVGEHKDINDEGQTVKVDESPETGDKNKINILIGTIFLISLEGLLITLIIKKRIKN